MKLTMTKKRASEIMSLACNHELKGTDDQAKLKRLLEVTLPELVEANQIHSRHNARMIQIMRKKKTYKVRRHICFDHAYLAEFYYSLHGGICFTDAERIIEAINDLKSSAGKEEIVLVTDGQQTWLEEQDSRDMLNSNEFYRHPKDLIHALNKEAEKAESEWEAAREVES